MKNLILLITLMFGTIAHAGLALDTPEVSAPITVTEYKISYFEVDIDTANIMVKYNKLSGTTVISSDMMMLQGAEVVAVFSIVPDGSKTLYDTIAQILYDKLTVKTGVTGHIE